MRSPWAGLILVFGAALLVLLGWCIHSTTDNTPASQQANAQKLLTTSQPRTTETSAERRDQNAQQVVHRKLVQFAQSRRKIAAALAKRARVEIPEQVDLFFDAIASCRWDDIEGLQAELSGELQGGIHQAALEAVWPAVLETLGVAEQTRAWPPEKLLSYGEAIIGNLTPGMIYVGGTDPGRFIPTLLNATTEGERHIILTQNALTDRLYLSYIQFLYGDRIATITEQEQETAYRDYLGDARRRLEHDTKFPDDQPELLPGENVDFRDGESGEVVISGQICVMAINERLLRRLMEKNPEATFALEESFPLKSTYRDASVLGPILQLRVNNHGNVLTREKAEEAVVFWRRAAETFTSAPEATEAFPVLACWAKMAAAQANLFAAHKFIKEAEQTFGLAQRIYSECPEAAFGLAQLRRLRNSDAR